VSIKAIAQFSIETDNRLLAEALIVEVREIVSHGLNAEYGAERLVQLDQLELDPAAPWLKVQGPGIARCERCGRNEPQPDLPLSIDALVAYMRYLVLRHVGCEAKA
jgi:hypothetical protein